MEGTETCASCGELIQDSDRKLGIWTPWRGDDERPIIPDYVWHFDCYVATPKD